jgi:1-hydroxy-2-naphthoate dioxygenase
MGGPCWIQMLRPGERTQPHRQTSSGMRHVASAAGKTTVDAVDLEWTDRDRFVIPNWAEHSFTNRSTTDEAILLAVHVIPTLEVLGLYCETPERPLGVAPWPAVAANVARPY